MVPAAERRLYVLAADIKHYGITDGCLGCESVAAHGKAIPGVGHTQECRSRVEELLSREVLGRARLERHRRKVRGATEAPEPEGSEKEMDAAEAAGEPVSKRKRASALAQEPQTPTSGDFQVGGSSASSGTAQGLATPEPPRNGTWAHNKSLG